MVVKIGERTFETMDDAVTFTVSEGKRIGDYEISPTNALGEVTWTERFQISGVPGEVVVEWTFPAEIFDEGSEKYVELAEDLPWDNGTARIVEVA